MKTLMLALSVMLFTTAAFSQVKADALVNFKETTYDFGKIKQGVPVNHEFAFTNVSSKPVVIESATASCGCTTPTWPQAPIAQGKSDKLKAGKFDAFQRSAEWILVIRQRHAGNLEFGRRLLRRRRLSGVPYPR